MTVFERTLSAGFTKEQTMSDKVLDFLDNHGGVATVSEMASLLDEDEGFVRRWARENDVRRAGSVFVFGTEKASELADELAEADEEEDEDDDEDEGAEEDADEEDDEDEDEEDEQIECDDEDED